MEILLTKFRLLKNFPFGVLVGVLATLMLCAGFDADVRDDISKFYSFIFSALIGLLAASIALNGVLTNLEKQSELSDRKHFAARAVMPSVLSGLYRKSELGFDASFNVTSLRLRSEGHKISMFEQLRLSNDEIDQIKDCIEAADPQTQAWLSIILSHWQLELSRLETSLFSKTNVATETQHALSAIDWLVIRAMIIQLFDYARSGSPPNMALDDCHVTIPIVSKHLMDESLAIARTQKLSFFAQTGGLSAIAFQNRLVDR